MDITKQIKKLAQEQKTLEIETLLEKIGNEQDYLNAVMPLCETYISLGFEFKDMKWFKEAEKYLMRIKDHATDRSLWNFLMSQAALYQFRFEEAFVYAQQGAALDADNPQIYLQLTKTLYWLGNEERALKAAQKGAGLAPGNQAFAILIKQIEENASPADVIATDFADYLEKRGKPVEMAQQEIETDRIILYKKIEGEKSLYAECREENGCAIISTGTKNEEGKKEKITLKKGEYPMFLRDFKESCDTLGYKEKDD